MTYRRPFVTALLIAGTLASVQTMLSFALPLLAYDIAQNGRGLALIKGAGFVPNVAFAIFIGVINDRTLKSLAYRRYTVALLLVTTLLAAALLLDRVSVAGLMIFTVVFNGLAYATSNAQMTLIRLTVPDSHLSDATALSATVHATISTIGPAVAGFLLLALGHTGLVLVSTSLLAGAAACAFMLNAPETLPPLRPFWPSLGEGWRVLRANRELWFMTIVVTLTNAAEGAYATGLILKLKTTGVNDFEIGIVLTCAGAGAILASRFAARIRRAWGYRPAFFWPIWGLALLYLAFILDLPFWLLCVLSFAEGGLSLFFAIGVWSTRAETTQAAHMGRVAGLTGAIFKLGMPPVIILSGLLADTGSLTWVFALGAAINVAAAGCLIGPARWGIPPRAA